MFSSWTRRTFFGAAGAASCSLAQAQGKTVKIIGVSCSPRRDRTTAAALRVCLEAAKGSGPDIEIELIDLGAVSYTHLAANFLLVI